MNVPSLTFGLFLSFVSVQSQPPISVSVLMNGDDITYPILLYHDEIAFGTSAPTLDNINSQGSLVCKSENHVKAQWRSASGHPLATERANYKQVESVAGSLPSLSQLSTPNDDASPTGGGRVTANGLWLCQLDNSGIPDQDILENLNYVGIYTRGNGAIGKITLSLVNPNFKADPPSFTLICDTAGGPPVTNTWTRNGDDIVISDGGPYRISLEVNREEIVREASKSGKELKESRYRSTLTVTGNLPGVYTYSVINRAMISFRRASYTIQGDILTDLTAVQIDLTRILINWKAPSDSPEFQIIVRIPGGAVETYSGESPFIYTTTVLGVYTVQQMSSSEHLPSQEIMVTMRGTGEAITAASLLTATSVTISWIPQPDEFRLPIIKYTISLTRVTGGGQRLCPQVTGSKPAVTTTETSMSFTGLEEFSSYSVIVTTTFNVSGIIIDQETEQMFTTQSAAPNGVPYDVVATSTSRSIMVTWDSIECIKRNGLITSYTVESDISAGSISGRIFLAEGLTPGRQYKFRVAGATDVDTGPFTRTISITTNEEVPGPVSDLTALAKFTSVDLTWSAPQEPNGIIISYEVTYRVGMQQLNRINTTYTSTSFIISSLSPQTTVSGLSVRAYTRIGRGEAATIADHTTLDESIVKNVLVTALSASSVRVSWDSLNMPEIKGYTVYYMEKGSSKRQSIVVPSSINYLVITDLLVNVDYKFQVEVLAEIERDVFLGETSMLTITSAVLSISPLSCVDNCWIVTGVVLGSLLIMIFFTTVRLVRRLIQNSRISMRRTSSEGLIYGCPEADS